MVTPDREDKRVLSDPASLLGTTSKKWDLVDKSKKKQLVDDLHPRRASRACAKPL